MPKIQHLIAINPPSDRDQPKSESKIKQKDRDQGHLLIAISSKSERKFLSKDRDQGQIWSRSTQTQIIVNLKIFMLIAITKNMIAINIAENPETQIFKSRKQHQRPQKPRLSPEINILTLY